MLYTSFFKMHKIIFKYLMKRSDLIPVYLWLCYEARFEAGYSRRGEWLEKGQVADSISKIAKDLSVGRPKVRLLLKHLEEAELIQIQRDKNGFLITLPYYETTAEIQKFKDKALSVPEAYVRYRPKKWALPDQHVDDNNPVCVSVNDPWHGSLTDTPLSLQKIIRNTVIEIKEPPTFVEGAAIETPLLAEIEARENLRKNITSLISEFKGEPQPPEELPIEGIKLEIQPEPEKRSRKPKASVRLRMAPPPHIIELAEHWYRYGTQDQFRGQNRGYSVERFIEGIEKILRCTDYTFDELSQAFEYIKKDGFWFDKATSPCNLLNRSKPGNPRKIDNIMTALRRSKGISSPSGQSDIAVSGRQTPRPMTFREIDLENARQAQADVLALARELDQIQRETGKPIKF